MEESQRPTQSTWFQGEGIGTKYKHPVIAARFSPEIDAVLRSLPNTSDYVRRAVIKQLIEDGLIDENLQPVAPDKNNDNMV